MAAVQPIRELDRLTDAAKLAQMQDFQLGWFWKIFNTLRLAPHNRLPFDGQFWSLAGARTKGFWDNNCRLVVSCFEIQNIAGQTWIWHEGLMRLAEAVSQFGNQPACREPDLVKSDKKRHTPIYELFLVAYRNYPKHIEKKESERKFLLAVKEHSKKQKIPETDSAEFIAQKCDEYRAATSRAGLDKQFIPSMAKWLHRGRFTDDPSEWVVSYSLNGKGKKSSLQEQFDALDKIDF